MLLAISAMINVITNENKKSWLILSVILSIFLGGGNYPTALAYTEILTLITLSLFISKNKNKYFLAGVTVITIISFLISILAPR